MAKKKKSSGGGASWQDTYGDMVTLLLCFFVLLYSMSTVSSEKWEILVKSLNPNAEEVSQIVVGQQANTYTEDVSGGYKPEENVDEFDTLYYQLVEYVSENNLQSDIELSRGDGFTFVTFQDNVFFDGDSYVLKEEGKKVLDDFCGMLVPAVDSIQELQVLGHTSQASPSVPNEPVSDRFLASDRATVVLLHIQQKNIIEPSKLVSSGFGQHRPISSFETREDRARNRRVEILITKTDSVVKTLEQYYEEAQVVEIP